MMHKEKQESIEGTEQWSHEVIGYWMQNLIFRNTRIKFNTEE